MHSSQGHGQGSLNLNIKGTSVFSVADPGRGVKEGQWDTGPSLKFQRFYLQIMKCILIAETSSVKATILWFYIEYQVLYH